MYLSKQCAFLSLSAPPQYCKSGAMSVSLRTTAGQGFPSNCTGSGKRVYSRVICGHPPRRGPTDCGTCSVRPSLEVLAWSTQQNWSPALFCYSPVCGHPQSASRVPHKCCHHSRSKSCRQCRSILATLCGSTKNNIYYYLFQV